MSRVGASIAGFVLILSGCTYYNSVYNAGRLFAEAEGHRRAGRDSISELQYLDVIRKTGQAYRARPQSEWAAEALFLLGRSRLRLGELRAAGAALEEAATRADDPVLRSDVQVYVAVVRAGLGDETGALERVNDALEKPLEGAALADAHLLRGRLLLAGAHSDQGWWDLDRASEINPAVRVEAGLERLSWSIRLGHDVRARWAIDGLLAYAEGGARLDTIVSLVRGASERWGPRSAAKLLAGADSSKWERTARGRIELERARLLHAAGDTAAAAEHAWRVAGGLGASAAEARLQLAAWQIERSRTLAELYAVRSILLPVSGNRQAARTLATVDELEMYTAVGLEEPLGWFAAAEVARDRLGADYLARGLFLAYADGAPKDLWAPKALLAALEVTPHEGDRAWLRGRLGSHADSPYVLAAFGRPAAGFEALEEELEVRLRALPGR
jgi:hypothetical protein